MLLQKQALLYLKKTNQLFTTYYFHSKFMPLFFGALL